MNWPPEIGTYIMDENFQLWFVKNVWSRKGKINWDYYVIREVTGKRGRPASRRLSRHNIRYFFQPTKLHLILADLDHLDIPL